MDSKVEVHAYVHGFFLLSTIDNGPVPQGRCCFWQPWFCPLLTNRISMSFVERTMKIYSHSGADGFR